MHGSLVAVGANDGAGERSVFWTRILSISDWSPGSGAGRTRAVPAAAAAQRVATARRERPRLGIRSAVHLCRNGLPEAAVPSHRRRVERVIAVRAHDRIGARRHIAIGLMIACTEPVMRGGPRVKRNSQAWSFVISSVLNVLENVDAVERQQDLVHFEGPRLFLRGTRFDGPRIGADHRHVEAGKILGAFDPEARLTGIETFVVLAD